MKESIYVAMTIIAFALLLAGVLWCGIEVLYSGPLNRWGFFAMISPFLIGFSFLVVGLYWEPIRDTARKIITHTRQRLQK